MKTNLLNQITMLGANSRRWTVGILALIFIFAALPGNGWGQTTIWTENFGSTNNYNLTTESTPWRSLGITTSVNYLRIQSNNGCRIDAQSLIVRKSGNSNNCSYQNDDDAVIIAYNTTAINASTYENLKIDFQWKGAGEVYSSGTYYDYWEVVICPGASSPTTAGNWSVVGMGKYAGNTTTQSVSNLAIPSSFNNTSFYIGFRWTNDNSVGGDNVQIDNVAIKGTLSCTPPTISYSGSPYVFCLNSPISNQTPSVTNSPTSFSISPALPAGLSFNTSTGVISGTPTTFTSATNYTITAINGCSGNTSISIATGATTTNKGTVSPSTTQTICSGETVAFTGGGTPSVNLGSVQYKWYLGHDIGAGWQDWQLIGTSASLPAYDPQSLAIFSNSTTFLFVRRVVSSCGQECFPNCPDQDHYIEVNIQEAPTNVNAGSDVAICTGESTVLISSATAPTTTGQVLTNNGNNWYYPFNTAYEDARSEHLYTGAELSAAGLVAGDINSVAFFVTILSGDVMNNFSVKIKSTSDIQLGSSFATGLTEVYSGTYQLSSLGWNTISFNNSFTWDGSSNLIFQFCFDNSSWNSASRVAWENSFSDGIVRSRHARADQTNGCSLEPSTNALYQQNQAYSNRPVIRLELTQPITYSWSSNPSGFASSVQNPTVNPTSTTTYTLTATSNGCSVTDQVTVTVINPTFTTQPQATSICTNGPGSFTVATNAVSPSYQWQYSTDNVNWANTDGAAGVSGHTSATLSLVNPDITWNGFYIRCILTSQGCSTTSNAVVMTIVPASFGGTATAAASTICSGSSTTVSVSGNTGTIQWQQSADGSTGWSTVTGGNGGTTSTYTTPNLTTTTYYRAVVTSGACSSANSTTATVTVTPTVGTPTAISVFAGTEPTCQLTSSGTTTTYVTTATNSTGLNWSVSPGGAGTIDATTGEITWALGFSGTATIAVTANGCSGPSNQSTRSVTINAAPSVTANASSTSPCLGQSVTLTGGGATSYSWSNGVTSASQTVAPTTTTTYTLTGTVNGCSGTAQVTVAAPTVSNELSGNNSSATCTVNQNGWVHFLDLDGRLVASINSNGFNLGTVTATSYLDAAPQTVDACDFPGNNLYATAVMGRHWKISVQNQPSVNDDVKVRLPYLFNEFDVLSLEAFNNTNQNDNVMSETDLGVTKYSGSNEDNLFSNNCGNGTFSWHQQSTRGKVNIYGGDFAVHDTNHRFIQITSPSFSEFWIHGSATNSPLPVELIAFTSECQNEDVAVKWSTASEHNSQHYVLQVSEDGYDWSDLHVAAAAGFSTTVLEYSYIHKNAARTKNYYRLRQYDNDGTVETYNTILSNCSSDEAVFMTFPNPSADAFTVVVNDKLLSGANVLNISDASGKLIYSIAVDLENGSGSFAVEGLNLSAGLYYLQLNNGSYASRIIKHSFR